LLSTDDNNPKKGNDPLQGKKSGCRVNDDPNLQSLLDLDGERFQMGGGYWTKFDVKLVSASDEIPHGIRYSLRFR
jgi:hypothetical protein